MYSHCEPGGLPIDLGPFAMTIENLIAPHLAQALMIRSHPHPHRLEFLILFDTSLEAQAVNEVFTPQVKPHRCVKLASQIQIQVMGCVWTCLCHHRSLECKINVLLSLFGQS